MNNTLLMYTKNIIRMGQAEVLNEGKNSIFKQFFGLIAVLFHSLLYLTMGVTEI